MKSGNDCMLKLEGNQEEEKFISKFTVNPCSYFKTLDFKCMYLLEDHKSVEEGLEWASRDLLKFPKLL